MHSTPRSSFFALADITNLFAVRTWWGPFNKIFAFKPKTNYNFFQYQTWYEGNHLRREGIFISGLFGHMNFWWGSDLVYFASVCLINHVLVFFFWVTVSNYFIISFIHFVASYGRYSIFLYLKCKLKHALTDQRKPFSVWG